MPTMSHIANYFFYFKIILVGWKGAVRVKFGPHTGVSEEILISGVYPINNSIFLTLVINLSQKELVLTCLYLQSDVRSTFWCRADNWLLGEGQGYPCIGLHIISLWSKSKVRD